MWSAVFIREAYSVLNNRWSAALALGPLLILSGLIIARWPSQAEVDVAGSRSRYLFALIGYTALACTVVLTPAFPAASIVRERREGTLALLMGTPISGAGIYAGKFLAALCCSLLPLAMTAPAVAACYAMGGISVTTDVLYLYALLLLTTVQYVTVALWVSSFTSRPSAAIRSAYGVVVALTVLTLGPSLLVVAKGAGPFSFFAEWVRSASPIPPFLEVLGSAPVNRLNAPGDGLSSTAKFAVASLLTSAVLAVITAARLKPTMLDRVRAAGTMTQDRRRTAQSSRRLLFLIDPQRRSGAMPGWINPVLIKELRSRRFGRGHWMVRLVMCCAVVSLALTHVATTGAIAWSPEAIGAIMVLLQTALIVLFTPSLASGMISDERETGGWPLLCMTPLTAYRIVSGKLMSVAWTVSLVLLATLPGYAVMILVKPVLWPQVRDVLITLVLITIFAVCLGGAVSALFRRTTMATLAAYLALVVLIGGPMIFWLGRDAPFGYRAVELALTFSPLAAALSLLKTPGFTAYQLLPGAWWTLGVGIVTCLAVLCWRTRQLTRPR